VQQDGLGGICFNCNRPWGTGCACQFCNQMAGCPRGVILSSSVRRLGAHLVDGVLCLVTCVIGWLIWSLIIYGNGQTPAKQLMGMRVVSLATGTRAGWGRMFVREHLAKLLIGLLVGWLVLPYFWLLWDKNRQELWDKLLDTAVVDDPEGQVTSTPQTEVRYVEQPYRPPQLPPSSEQPTSWGQQPNGNDRQGEQGGYPPYPPPPPPPAPPRR
jgi:uncharacterized RDD family membrane protein YckC